MKRILAYYLLINTLLASLYVPVIIHKCNLFDSTTTALFIAPKCCELPCNESESVDVDCCSEIHSTFSAELIGVNVYTDFISLEGHKILPLEFTGFFESSSASYIKSLKNRPPPSRVYNRALLISYQTFLV